MNSVGVWDDVFILVLFLGGCNFVIVLGLGGVVYMVVVVLLFLYCKVIYLVFRWRFGVEGVVIKLVVYFLIVVIVILLFWWSFFIFLLRVFVKEKVVYLFYEVGVLEFVVMFLFNDKW